MKKVLIEKPFQAVRPGGGVHPEEIPADEVVEGRLAEIALEIGHGVEVDEKAIAKLEAEKAKAAAEAGDAGAAE